MISISWMWGIAKTLILSLLDGLEGFSRRWTFIRALKVSNEHGTQLVLGFDGCFG
jgi:hypothetical protein